MSYKQIIGNIFSSKEKYIVHQTNCVSRGNAAGLAKLLFNNYDYADCYTDRTSNSNPGTIDIRGNGTSQRYVINLMGQFLPGRISSNVITDTYSKRIQYFISGLSEMAKIDNLKSIAFPAGIGCAIAGGDWNLYIKEIGEFYNNVNKFQKVDVIIYCLPMNIGQFNFKEIER